MPNRPTGCQAHRRRPATPVRVPPRRLRGFSLIEVLVATLVLGVGLIGLAGLQATALRSNHTAYRYSQAALLAGGMLEQLRAQRSAAYAGAYDVAHGETPARTRQWKADLQARIQGDGSIDCTTTPGWCDVVITWPERTGADVRLAFGGRL
jgi:type IV pilus assembly protein PilV